MITTEEALAVADEFYRKFHHGEIDDAREAMRALAEALLPRVRSKEQFLVDYAIARASGHAGGLDGAVAVYEAERAWEEIKRRMTP